jgi:DNA mismatch repair protein MutS2
VARARAEERTRLQRESSELSVRVREARGELERATARLKKAEGGGSREELRALEKDVSRAAREIAVGSPLETALRPAARSAESRPLEPKVGARVYVPKLRTHAEIAELLGGGKVRIAAGSMKVVVRVDELAEPGAGGSAAAPKAKKPAPRPLPPSTDATPVRTSSNTADVRGLRVDEAREQVEALLDRLLSQGEPAGFVLHGHGTGALKAALREHLTLHRLVAKARAADEEDGGDAFTVFWLA